MAAPYSVDLRKKVVDVSKSEKLTQSQLAKRFKLRLSSVKKICKLRPKNR